MSTGGEGQETGSAIPTPRPGGGAHRKRPTGGDRKAPRRSVRFNSGFTTLRDLISFVVGLGIVVHEVVAASVELFAMGAGLSLMGLPFALAADEKRKGGD